MKPGEWYDFPFNVVTGCRKGCPNCYAEREIKGFSGNVAKNLSTVSYMKDGDLFILGDPVLTARGGLDRYPFGFLPTLHRYRYDMLDEYKGGKTFYVSSLGDMFAPWVGEKYIAEIFRECEKRTRHNYVFLTQFPERYGVLDLPDGDNFWYGATVRNAGEINRLGCLPEGRHRFINIEPVMEQFEIPLAGIEWVIIGAEISRSGSRVVPEPGWITVIVEACASRNIPVFMKPSLLPIMGKTGMVRELPESLRIRKKSIKRLAHEEAFCAVCRNRFEKKTMVTLYAKIGREGRGRSICFMCTDCYERWCSHTGIDGYIEELKTRRVKRRKDEKKELQEN